MVFESIVADLLNRYLGDYVENLDSKQLNVGIWGGDVVLRNLDIRPTALDNLDLPVKLKSGSLGSLTLKIPWKNLYTEAVVATIEDLYIVATPNLGIKYDSDKEEKQAQDTKQRELQRIEEQRKAKRKKPDPADAQQQDTFVEKLVTQVIKNLQVKIRDIHIRYEDEFTNPKRPFALGVTMHSLVFQTTDEQWNPCVLKETVKMFYKLVDLDSLTLYWNSGTKLISQIESREETKRVMREMIASKTTTPGGFSYMLSPISLSAKLIMNPKPEIDGSGFKIPKMLLTVVMEELGFHIGKYQYQDMLEFLEAQERLRLNALYRKYRPDLKTYQGHSKEWWHFAMNAVLKDQIQRKSKNWSWNHMKSHRELVRKYTKAWIEQLTNKSPPNEDLDIIHKAEKELDVFNLNIARQQAELYVDRKQLTRVEDQGGIMNYVKSWWWGSKQTTEEGDIGKKFEKAMTPEERAKLYDALDYHENQLPTTYPKEFVENKVKFSLNRLMVVVDDDVSVTEKTEVMIITCHSVNADMEQRPSANAIKFDMNLEKFQIDGIQAEDGQRPSIVESIVVNLEEEKNMPQLHVHFETNPLDGAFDQLVKVYARPLAVIYHAMSINKLAEVFRPPESVRLKQLAAAAFAKYEDIKERSATGLQYALEKRAVLKLDIKVLPTIIQIPYRGVMEKSSDILVIDLGTLRISTMETAKVKTDEGFYKMREEEKLKMLRESAYDRFKVDLKTLQILFARPGDDWRSARTQKTSPMHFLQPTGWEILLEKASIDDLRLPKLRILGELPDLNFTASEMRLLDILKLLVSIPTPPPAPEAPAVEDEIEIVEPTTRDRAKMKAILEATGDGIKEEEEEEALSEDSDEAKQKKEKEVNKEQVQIELSMILKQISVHLSRRPTPSEQPQPYLSLLVSAIGTNLKMRALDMHAMVSLGGIEVKHLQYKAPDGERPLHILENPDKANAAGMPLLQLDYIQADKKSPFFVNEFRSIEQLVRVKAQPLNLVLHQEAFVDLQNFGLTLQKKLDALKAEEAPPATLAVPNQLERHASRESIASSTKSAASSAMKKAIKKRAVAGAVDDRIINMKLEANLAGLAVVIARSTHVISDVRVEGLTTDVSMRPKTMEAVVKLKVVSITDPTPESTYNKILSVAGDEVFSLRFVQFNRSEKERNKMGLDDVDMEVVMSLAEMRYVFLNLHMAELMAWMAPFQEQASAAAEQAGAAMQEGAKTAAVAFEGMRLTTRMRLRIEVHAPVIIVPQSSRSDEALLADFGKLTVANKFTAVPVRAGTSTSAVFDHLTVQLRDMKLSRVILGEDRWTVAAECRILEPVSFELLLIRNLSFGFYKEKPEVAVVGRLPLLKVCASSEDYGVAMKTLSGNLSEGVPPPTQAQTPAQTTVPQKKTESAAAVEQVTVQADIETAPEETPTGTSVKMEFSFEIQCIAAQLYDGSSNLLKGITQRDPNKALALVEIKMIAVKGAMLENGAMDAKVFLQSFIMDDSRKDQKGLTRLMDKKGGPAAASQNMIDILYIKDAAAKQKAEVIMRPFFLFVCPEFLGALARFFVVTKTDEELAIEEQYKATNGQQETKPEQQKKSSQQAAAASPTPAGSMEAIVSIQDPEIVLVEDATAPETTKAIVMSFRADFRMDSNSETTAITGGVFGLGINSTYFALEKRENPLKVLSPCDISVQMNMPKDGGQRIEIIFTPLKIRVSPNVIGLLSAVGAHMAVTPEQSAREKQAKMIARQHVWDKKTVAESNFWFMNEVLQAEEAVEKLFTPVEEMIFDDSKEDKCRLEISKIELTLEADAGGGTVPMIHLTSAFEAEVREWTRQMSAESALKLELWYYNERFNVWEPLIEPIMESDGTSRPWQVETYVMQRSEYDSADTEVVIQPPKMEIAVVATDGLQLTVTKTLLDLLTELGDAFARAAKRIEPKKPKGIAIEYLWAIKNDSGVTVHLDESEAFSPLEELNGVLPYYTMVELQCKMPTHHIGGNDNKQPMLLALSFPDLDIVHNVDVARAEKRMFTLPKSTDDGDHWHVVVDTMSTFGNKLVTIRSPVKFINHLPVNLEVYYRSDGNLESAGTVSADGGEFSPALHVIHTTSGEIWFQPTGDNYDMGREAICWRYFQNTKDWQTLIECPSVNKDQTSYFVQASVEKEEAYFENTHRKNTRVLCHVVHLSAPTLFRNALPYPLEISATGVETQMLQGGESASLCSVVPGRSICLKIRADMEFTCNLEIMDNFDELTQHTFHGRHPATNVKMEFDLGLRTTRRCGTQEMTLYCPFWMINKTGMPLAYKDYESSPNSSSALSISPCSCFKGGSGKRRESENYLSVFEHPPGSDEPLLFTFSGDSFFAKNKKACLKVGESSWSDKFPLDIVGSAGKVACKSDSGKEYEVSVNIQLSYSGLTKICTFTPYYLVDNRSNGDVEVRQVAIDGEEKWTKIPHQQCLGFWPEKKSKRMQMACRYVEDQDQAESQPFPFTESLESMVVMPNEFVGMFVSTHISDNAVVIALEEYQDGMAPVLLVNDTEGLDVYYRQKDIDQINGLQPSQCVLFSWTSVLMKRQLLWSCGDSKNIEDDLMRDGMGEVKAKKDVKVYWVSFLSGRQRILLFTEDLAVATIASKPYELERIDQQFTVSIQSVNISLINNLIGMEIASMAVTSSGIIWEYKKRRFKAFSIKDNKRLEEAFVKFNNERNEGKKVKSRMTVHGTKLEVDFEEMKQYKPKEMDIRRSFQSGFWMQYMQSQHEQQMHLKVNHFQIDNQLPVSVFHTVFAPVPPAKSVAAESIPKPFAEVSFIMRKVEHSNIPQVKYFMVLVQEMAVQADKGFINAMIEMFTNETAVSYGTELYEKDMDLTRQSLTQLAAITTSTEQKAYYEYLHFSPMRIHLSFSQGGSAGEESGKATPIHSEVLNLLLKSVGVTLTEIQDVQFKLAYLERKAVFMNRQQLISEAVSHYTKQAIKQLYVLVLGLDIMGNPFGLIRDLSTGVETFFYEPIQGAIQGPEEFAEGLALGLKGLFGGAVGGAAGAVSRITGTLGKGLAALTLDDEYQRKRQQMISRRPANVQEGFAQGAKGLAMGFVEGVTGVFTKPIEGAKKGGVGGFAVGVGKGVVGLVTRPVSGVVDFASSSLQAVKRVADTSEEVKKLRPARFIEPDKIIRPFSLVNAEGNQFLQDAAKGKFASTDVYLAHAPVTADKEFHIIVTDKRILMVSKTLGALEVDWQYTWHELAEPPTFTGKELKVKLKERKKKLFGSGSQGKRVAFSDQQLGEMIAASAKEAFERDQ